MFKLQERIIWTFDCLQILTRFSWDRDRGSDELPHHQQIPQRHPIPIQPGPAYSASSSPSTKGKPSPPAGRCPGSTQRLGIRLIAQAGADCSAEAGQAGAGIADAPRGRGFPGRGSFPGDTAHPPGTPPVARVPAPACRGHCTPMTTFGPAGMQVAVRASLFGPAASSRFTASCSQVQVHLQSRSGSRS